MSITINGATNTVTAASGLAIAGNTAVTGTLSATDKLTLTSPSTAQSIEIRNRASDDVYSGIYFKTNDGVTDQTIIQNERVGTNGGRLLLYTKADGGALTNNCILSSTALTLGSGVNLEVNAGNLSGGAPTYGGDILLSQRGGAVGINSAGGIELKIDSSGAGYGARLFQWFDGVSGYNTSIQTRSNSATWSTALTIDRSNTSITPGTDNTISLGAASLGWKELFCDNGTINTSDARRKTEVSALSAAEINAAKQLAKEIGSFKFLAAVAEKGDAARNHIGMTVQRAIAIMESNGLDPFAYSFICHDAWDDVFVDHPAVEAVAAQEAVLDEDGNVVTPSAEAVAAVDAWTEQTQVAGDKYSFRVHELLLFMAAGFEARLAALEAA